MVGLWLRLFKVVSNWKCMELVSVAAVLHLKLTWKFSITSGMWHHFKVKDGRNGWTALHQFHSCALFFYPKYAVGVLIPTKKKRTNSCFKDQKKKKKKKLMMEWKGKIKKKKKTSQYQTWAGRLNVINDEMLTFQDGNQNFIIIRFNPSRFAIRSNWMLLVLKKEPAKELHSPFCEWY